ncbi:MAG: hypothetical protein JW751_16940 [Polyangiaceae bacterium]|nr:hypothetical protein [Polyangiaceae bacterium]
MFRFGDTLTEELNQTLIDTSVSDEYLLSGPIAPDTPPGTLVHEASRFGNVLWASDHYLVITEQLDRTSLDRWETYGYSVCTAGHTVPRTYRHCNTIYETRPNPAYVPPDNSGGDRACNGVTLADCLRSVARVASPTIDVPIGTECTEHEYQDWVCDAHEYRTATYPRLITEYATRLFIYEYTDAGFVRLATQVSEITTAGIEEQTLDDVVSTLTTSPEAYDLAVPGIVQTLYFQNGFLYVISDGILQVYAMGESSLVRTASLAVVEDRLQTSLFTDDRLYLSDSGYSAGHDQSMLRVVDLTNPAFPRQASQDRTLPGGHSVILPTLEGILNIGAVANFEPGIPSIVKLGLFTDPFASELAYLILGTDLSAAYLGDTKAHYFDAAEERLFVAYHGEDRDTVFPVARVGVSHLEPGTIVTEGAVAVPELSARVRPRPGAVDEILSFATSSVEWLRPAGAKWSATPLLEYFTPIALYRRTAMDDYVEVLRLGWTVARDLPAPRPEQRRAPRHQRALPAAGHRPKGITSAGARWGTLGSPLDSNPLVVRTPSFRIARGVAAALRLRRGAGPAAGGRGPAAAGRARAEPGPLGPGSLGAGTVRAPRGDPRGRARGAATGDHARLLPPGAADRGLTGEPRAGGARHGAGRGRDRGALDLVRDEDGLVRVRGARALGQ